MRINFYRADNYFSLYRKFIFWPTIHCGLAIEGGLDRVFDFLGAHFENCATGRVFSKKKVRMPRQNIVRERNERGFYLFLQNLKGVLSLCQSDEVFWTEDLIEETTKRLQDSYTTLTLIEHDWHDMSCPNEQSTARAFATIGELCSISSHGSCFLRNCCIKCRQFCFILSSTKSKGRGSRTWKTGFEHNEI